MLTPPNKQTNDDLVHEKLAELQQEYSRKLPEKIAQINDLWQKLMHYSWNNDAFSLLQRVVHSLAGSGKTFGFEELSFEALKLDKFLIPFLNQHTPPDSNQRKHIEALIGGIESSAKSCSYPHKEIAVVSRIQSNANAIQDKVLYIVDDDIHLSRYLNTIFSNMGYRVRYFTAPKEALAYIPQCTPDLVIMDVMFPGGDLQGIETIEDFRALVNKRLPFIFISSRTDLNARVKAVRSGGDAYITKPLNFQQLTEKVEQYIRHYSSEQYRVLIVDDESDISSFYQLMLRNAGMKPMVINQPVKILETLASFQPDIVLMDMYMPDYDGLELASVIRQEDDFIGMPIIFVSAEADKDIHHKAYDLGADDFIVKPVTPEVLIEKINKQVTRSRAINHKLAQISKYGSSTSLVNRQYFLEQLEFAITSSNSDHIRFLIDINITNFKFNIERAGYEKLDLFDEQIANLIRVSIDDQELITHLSESVFLVLTRERSKKQVVNLLTDIKESFNKGIIRVGRQVIRIQSSMGVLPLNQNIENLHEALRLTTELSSKASQNGINEFLIHKPEEQSDINADVNRSDAEILAALKNNQFALVFQPVINIENNSDEKYQVLARLHDDKGRTILPQQFLPLVEENSLFVQLDRWVVEHAISSLANDSHARGSSDLFIKITLQTIQDKTLLPKISNALTAAGIPGNHRIIFEISEQDLLSELDDVAAFAKYVQKLNCGISIDRYGEFGIQSNYFGELPINYVKLHQSCVDNIMQKGDSEVNAKLMVKLALTNGAQIIAAQIEDPMVLSTMWNLGVRHFQGYFIKEPDFKLNYNFSASVTN